MGNFAKAIFNATFKIYSHLTPELYKEKVFTKSPYQEPMNHLMMTHTCVLQSTQTPAVVTMRFFYTTKTE